MSEQDELMQLALSAVQGDQKSTATAPEAAPAEPAKKDEPKAGTEGSGKVDAKPEVKVEPPKDEPKKQDWKAAAAAERQKQQARQQGKSQNAQLQQQVKEMQQQLAQWNEIQALKDKDPLEAAAKSGFSYDVLTKKYLESLDKNPTQTPPEYKSLIQNFQQLEGRLQTLQQELNEERRQKIVSGFDSDVKAVLQAKADDFELLKTAEEGPALVRAIVANHWKQTAKIDSQGRLVEDGETMPTEEACKLAEEYFEEKQLKRFAGTKKFAALAKPEPPKVEDKKTTTTTLSRGLIQGGGETQSFTGEFEELAAIAKRLEAQGN